MDNLYNQACDLLLDNKYEDAIEICDIIIRKDNNYVEAYNNKAICLRKLKKYQESIEISDKILEKDKNILDAYNNKALCLEYFENYEEAIKCLDIVIEKDENHVLAYFSKAFILEELREYKEAIKLYDIIIQKDENDMKAYNKKALLLQKLKEYKEAIRLYDIIIQKDEDDILAHSNKASCFKLMNEYDEAIKIYDIIIDMDSDYLQDTIKEMIFEKEFLLLDKFLDNRMEQDSYDEFVLEMKFSSLIKQRRFEEAFDFLNDLISENPNDYWLKYQLSNFLILYPKETKTFVCENVISLSDEYKYYKGEITSIKNELKQNLNNDERLEKLSQLVDAYIRIEKEYKAKNYYEQMLNLNNNEETTLIEKAECMYRLNEYEEALVIFKNILKKKKTPVLYFYAANCLQKLKRNKEALDLLNKRMKSKVILDENIELYRADLLKEMKFYDEALKIFDYILKEKRKLSIHDEINKKAMIGKINCLNLMKRNDEARAFFKEFFQKEINLENR